jgi:hypothetical protein
MNHRTINGGFSVVVFWSPEIAISFCGSSDATYHIYIYCRWSNLNVSVLKSLKRSTLKIQNFRQQKCLSSRRHVWISATKHLNTRAQIWDGFYWNHFWTCWNIVILWVAILSVWRQRHFFVSAILTPDFTRFHVRTVQFLGQCKMRGMPMVTT